jgi:putative transposase
MPRLPRYSIPGQPQHVIQRGNNRSLIFKAADEFQFFRECLRSARDRSGCQIHAYVFMTNHVHLLLSPGDPHGISDLMQSLGRRYVKYFNDRHARTGTLFEGRFRATVVDTEEYLLTCYRYIEENPVRAGLAQNAAGYRWSSHAANAYGAEDNLVTPHERYEALGSTRETRQATYRALFRYSIELPVLTSIRHATNRAKALGSDQFCRRMGQQAATLAS